MSIQRVIRGALVAAVALASSVAGAVPGRSHPHFDDGGTLPWFQDLDEARSAARASGKLIFIDYGRYACGNCRRLVSNVLPNPMVRHRLAAVAVGLASDCDRADPRVERILSQRLGHASMLPFVAVVTHDLRWVTGWSGGMEVHGVAREISTCETWLRSQRGPTASTSAPAPRAARAPVAAARQGPVAAVRTTTPAASGASASRSQSGAATVPVAGAPSRAVAPAPAAAPARPAPQASVRTSAAPPPAARTTTSPAPAIGIPPARPKAASPRPAPCAPDASDVLGDVGSLDECDDGEMHCEGGVCYLKPLRETMPRADAAPAAPPPPAPLAAVPPPPAPTRFPGPVAASPLADPRPVAAPAAPPPPVADVVREPARPRAVGAPSPRTAGSTVAPRAASAGAAPRVALSTPAPRGSVAAARPALPSRSAPEGASRAARPPEDRPASRLERAREAAAEGRFGDVIRLGNEAEKAAPSVDSWEMDLLVRRARTWALDGMNDAVQDSLRGDYDSAARTLDRVRRAMTGLPVEIDAERGQRALLRLSEISRGSPDATETPDALRKAAYSEFRGTRWAVLFKAS
jgi:hypothetical protein